MGKIKSYTVDFLDTILSLAETMTEISADRKAVYRALNGRIENEWTMEKICKYLHSLKRSNYIKIVKQGNLESIQFTNRAKLKLIDKIALRSKIDNKYHIVSFDIPERLKTNRNSFRSAIKRLGFKQIQKSLWVNNRDVGDMVEMAALEYHVSEYIVYFISDISNIDKTIKQILTKSILTS